MRPPLRPVHALAREAAPRTPEFVNINAQLRKPPLPLRPEFEIAFSPRLDHAGRCQFARQFDGDAPREMVVAGPRQVQVLAGPRADCAGGERRRRNPAQRFQRVRDFATRQGVIAVPARAAHREQPPIEQLGKVPAGRLRGNVRSKSQLARCPGAAIQQGHQNRRTRGVADQFSYSREGIASVHAFSVTRL